MTASDWPQAAAQDSRQSKLVDFRIRISLSVIQFNGRYGTRWEAPLETGRGWQGRFDRLDSSSTLCQAKPSQVTDSMDNIRIDGQIRKLPQERLPVTPERLVETLQNML